MTDANQIRHLASAGLQSGDRETIATAVRESLDWFADRNPGRAVEVRVPPFRVVQVLGGTTHRRGTPPAIVEMKPVTWLALMINETTWDAEIAMGTIQASGERSDLGEVIALTLND